MLDEIRGTLIYGFIPLCLCSTKIPTFAPFPYINIETYCPLNITKTKLTQAPHPTAAFSCSRVHLSPPAVHACLLLQQQQQQQHRY